jgi:hypothetical protein
MPVSRLLPFNHPSTNSPARPPKQHQHAPATLPHANSATQPPTREHVPCRVFRAVRAPREVVRFVRVDMDVPRIVRGESFNFFLLASGIGCVWVGICYILFSGWMGLLSDGIERRLEEPTCRLRGMSSGASQSSIWEMSHRDRLLCARTLSHERRLPQGVSWPSV